MRKSFYFVIVAAGHVVVIDQGVDDGFFGRLTVAVNSGSISSLGMVLIALVGGEESAA